MPAAHDPAQDAQDPNLRVRGTFLLETFGLGLKHTIENDLGVSPARLAILAMVKDYNDRNEPITATDIRDFWADFRSANVHRMVPSLVRDRLVRRRADPADRRSLYLRITPEGEALLADAQDKLAAIELPAAIEAAVEIFGERSGGIARTSAPKVYRGGVAEAGQEVVER